METKVSVIVPVYNVEKYVEKCLYSIVNQTYKNLEIIVINDGSLDRSGEICERWAKKENFIYLSKCNEGLGPTRNLGIKMAHGKYIMFVDSDDWLRLDAVELLVAEMKKESLADFVSITSFFEYHNEEKSVKQIVQNENIGLNLICDEKRKRMFLLYGFMMMCGKLFSREFLLNNNILMPNIPYEDVGVFPEIVFSAKGIGFCNNPLYYYRVGRKGSIINDFTNRIYMSNACEYFLKHFKERRILDLHYAGIKRFVERQLKNSYDIYCQYVSDAEQQELVYNRFAKLHRSYFYDQKPYWEYKFALFGSFGSRWILHHLGNSKEQLIYHLPFSSVIAQMTSGELDKYIINNQNIFRQEKIADDIKGGLSSILEDFSEQTDYLFIDFLEERYNVAELDDGNYITLSEALEDSIVERLNIKRVVKMNTLEHFELWKLKCKKFVELIKEKYERKKIVLIRSRLATEYLMEKKLVPYPERDSIIKTNIMIEKMENYFLSLMANQIQTYSYPEMIYSDNTFRMGAKPHYLTDSLYWLMNVEISVSLERI